MWPTLGARTARDKARQDAKILELISIKKFLVLPILGATMAKVCGGLLWCIIAEQCADDKRCMCEIFLW